MPTKFRQDFLSHVFLPICFDFGSIHRTCQGQALLFVAVKRYAGSGNNRVVHAGESGGKPRGVWMADDSLAEGAFGSQGKDIGWQH